MSRIAKWLASGIRLVYIKIRLGNRLVLPKGGKPVYIGPGAHIRASKGACVILGAGSYLSERVLLQANSDAKISIGARVFFNANVRIVATESVRIGEATMFGPNVCVYDHDHVFDKDGVHSDLKTTPVEIGSHCWIGANALVTRGCEIVDKVLVGGGVSRYEFSG